MKNIVIVSSSMRNGNSNILCDEFEKGAKDNNNVFRIDLRNIKLNFCKACSDCYTQVFCNQNDDMNKLYEKIKNADILVFATPVYFGEISGQLKVFIDRLYPIYYNLKATECYIIATCYQNNKEHINSSLNSIKRFLNNTPNHAQITKIIYGENTDECGDVTSEQRLNAYNIGKQIN